MLVRRQAAIQCGIFRDIADAFPGLERRLADIVAAPFPELDPIEHADLKVDAKKLKNLGTVDKALLVDRYGQLVTLDPKSATEELSQSEQTIEKQRERWKQLKDKKQTQGGGTALDKMAAKFRGSASSSADPAAMNPGAMMMPNMSSLKKSSPGAGGSKATGAKKKATAQPVRSGAPGGAPY